MHLDALRKYLADSGTTEVVKPGDLQYGVCRGKVLEKAVAATIEPPKFHFRAER